MKTFRFVRSSFAPAIKNRTLNILAAVCFILFATLNVVHYGAFTLNLAFANSALWLDMRTLANSILINLMAAYIFFFLIVHLPNIRAREVIRNNLRSRYHDFKMATIGQFLGLANGSYQFDLAEKLCEIGQFRDYFKKDDSARWYAIANALDGDRSRLNEILVELAILRAEVSFVITKIEIQDEQVLSFFKNISSTMYRLERGNCDKEDVKSLMQFMWQLFAGWSWVQGYAEEDIVQKLIQKI